MVSEVANSKYQSLFFILQAGFKRKGKERKGLTFQRSSSPEGGSFTSQHLQPQTSALTTCTFLLFLFQLQRLVTTNKKETKVE